VYIDKNIFKENLHYVNQCIFLLLFCVSPLTVLKAEDSLKYKYRKYMHVKNFYEEILPIAVDVGLEYNIPPAALLAIAGLESGYGRGYVAQITGNILSLGANKSEKELPRLNLPYSKSKKMILYDSIEIQKHPASDLTYKFRSRSYKKDYRPKEIRGSSRQLNYFKYHKKERLAAYRSCFEDFSKIWISKQARYRPFREAREYLDKQVKEYGKKILFNIKTDKEFILLIGGRKNSFNYRKSWRKRVFSIINNVGLPSLVDDVVNHHKSFNKAWSKRQ
jgi:hypothetical protein